MSRIDSRSQAGRALSQHSLRDANVAARIVAHSGLAPPDTVYEIGAGSGTLTAALACAAGRVIAVEQHRPTWAALKSRFESNPRVVPVLGDFLRYPLPRQAPYKVVANPPFEVTSALIRRLLGESNPPVETLIVVQREAALRWSGETSESVASLVAKVRFEFDIRLALRRVDFRPYPRVSCVLLGIKPRPAALLSPAEERRFEAFVRSGFHHGGSGSRRGRSAHPSRPSERSFQEWLALFRARNGARRTFATR